MRVLSLVSGGKDSVYASWVAQQWGWDVAAYVTFLPEATTPMLFHRPNAKWVELQARAAGIPWRGVPLPRRDDEEAVLRKALQGLKVDGITTGALASEFQRTRFERACHAAGLKTFSPLWRHEPSQHLHDLLGSGIRAIFVHVAANGLGREWLGRTLDDAAVGDLERVAQKHRINVAGEGGEYETFVTHAPHFRSRIEIQKGSSSWARDSGTYEIQRARLVPA